MYFSSCSAFNDPFEGKPHIERVTDLEKLLRQHQVLMKRSRSRMSAEESLQWSSEYINRSFNLANAESTWNSLDKDLLAAINKVGMLCLSATRDNVLMWSHYAVKHTGYCIEFDASLGDSFFGDAREVRYQENYPTIQAFEKIGDIELESTQAAILTKSLDWAYEKEFRVLMSGGPGMRSYPKERMRAVAFGCNMKQEHKEKIMEWISQRGHSVEFLQAKINKRKYLVDFEAAN